MTLKQRKHMAKTDCMCIGLVIICGLILMIDHKVALGLTVVIVFGLLLLVKLYQLYKLSMPKNSRYPS